MKREIITTNRKVTTGERYSYFSLFIVSLFLSATTALSSCSSDDLSPTSVFQDSTQEENAFDRWIHDNYVMAYNIDLKYRMEDIETDYHYTLVPADMDKSIKLAHIVRYCWLQAYDEVAGVAFTRRFVPKVLHSWDLPPWDETGLWCWAPPREDSR